MDGMNFSLTPAEDGAKSNEQNLSGLSLHLFECLIALVQEHSVTRAAERLGLAQPQMSRMLIRLREITNDPLLVRTSGGMLPTPLALEIAACAAPFVAKIDSIISTRGVFTPATARNTFKIQAVDYFTNGILARLCGIVQRDAPNARLIIAPPRLRELRETLESGSADLVVSQFADIAETLYASKLFDVPQCCIARNGHPAITGVITVEQYCAIPHVALGFGRDNDPFISEQRIDTALREHGLSRRKSVFVHSVLSIPNIVASSDLIGTLPLTMAQEAARQKGISVMPLPIVVPPSEIYLAWHERTHSDPGHIWLRQLIRTLAHGQGS